MTDLVKLFLELLLVLLMHPPVTVVPGPVAVFCMVYHYTKRAMLTRLLGNMGPAIYIVL